MEFFSFPKDNQHMEVKCFDLFVTIVYYQVNWKHSGQLWLMQERDKWEEKLFNWNMPTLPQLPQASSLSSC